MIKKCRHCKDPFTCRKADHDRGWALFCSKSCKAKHQEARTGQYARHQQRATENDGEYEDAGWDAHKAWSAS